MRILKFIILLPMYPAILFSRIIEKEGDGCYDRGTRMLNWAKK